MKKKRVRLDDDVTEKRRIRMRKVQKASLKARAKSRANGDGKRGYKYRDIIKAYDEAGLVPDLDRFNNPKSGKYPWFERFPSKAKTMIRMIGQGFPPDNVCREMGVRFKTFLRWLELGAKGRPHYQRFYVRVVRAEARYERSLIKKLQKHQNSDWRPVTWEMERRYPNKWGKQEHRVVDHNVSGNVTVEQRQRLGTDVVKSIEARNEARGLIEDVDYEVVDK